MEPVPKYWTPAVPLVDDPDVPRRIAITSGPLQNLDNWFAAPFLGRQLQNAVTYEPLSADGKIWPLGSEDIIRTASFEAWKRRSHDHHVTEVMSFTPRSMELEWMEAHPDLFEKRCGDREWGLFRLK